MLIPLGTPLVFATTSPTKGGAITFRIIDMRVPTLTTLLVTGAMASIVVSDFLVPLVLANIAAEEAIAAAAAAAPAIGGRTRVAGIEGGLIP